MALFESLHFQFKRAAVFGCHLPPWSIWITFELRRFLIAMLFTEKTNVREWFIRLESDLVIINSFMELFFLIFLLIERIIRCQLLIIRSS